MVLNAKLLMVLLSSVHVSIIVIVDSEKLPLVISFLTRWKEIDYLGNGRAAVGLEG